MSLAEGTPDFEQVASALQRPATHTDAEGSGNCLGFAARDSGGALSPYRFKRRDATPDDVVIQIAFCGICHSGRPRVRGWRDLSPVLRLLPDQMPMTLWL